MSQVILKAENISKQYRLGTVGTGTLSHDLNRWWHRLRGKEDPYLKVGSVNDRSTEADSDYVWALQDINFEVQQGEVLGIIGKNGAGKSTLLKILSRVTSPTTGEIKTRGRIASLLEVGTGFHPELTGRENIYLNGAILGMTKKEIRAKEDAIIDFSGCARYVDTPVKRYSSGMRVRLAFAVAAFLEPDILVIDEVLAVGDAEFQKKAIGKMQDISQGEGRTVLFVSHNMAAVKSLCTRAIMLEYGKLVFEGTSEEVVNRYLNDGVINFGLNNTKLLSCESQEIKIEDISLKSKHRTIQSGFDLQIEIVYSLKKKVISPSFVVQIMNENDVEMMRFSNFPISGKPIDSLYEQGKMILEIDELPLTGGQYWLNLGFTRANMNWFFKVDNVLSFEVEPFDVYNSGHLLTNSKGFVWTRHDWIHEKLL
ncbi:ABC transporter ATP-binding protein [Mangrovimonas futianensis]|uniref:ABC transporter ATP-binding protein n=1 Tax=Mangrovimonas futianensis TaxID=2895523 RepID=UPI001E5897CE|nr:ABC transporter ATP-binding protein [Mangrovimonas futianensis]MCF1421386.1 ABC transporter ATP-binding protein [Mangrovimonas futianensis]